MDTGWSDYRPAAGAYYAWKSLNGDGLPEGIARGNGRIEAVEIDISTKSPGRIREILVDEGDFVQANDILARMDTDQLESQLKQAEAQLRRAEIGIETARSLVTQREAEHTAAEATVAQREAQLDAAQRRLARSQQLTQTRTISQQVLDDDRATAQGAEAAVGAAKAQLAATEAAIGAAKAQVIDAEASVEAARAAIASIQADINDATLRAPKPGRVQYRVAQPGEVLSAGGRVLNLVDVSDVYMTFSCRLLKQGGSPLVPRPGSFSTPRRNMSFLRILALWPMLPSSRPRPWKRRRSARN